MVPPLAQDGKRLTAISGRLASPEAPSLRERRTRNARRGLQAQTKPAQVVSLPDRRIETRW